MGDLAINPEITIALVVTVHRETSGTPIGIKLNGAKFTTWYPDWWDTLKQRKKQQDRVGHAALTKTVLLASGTFAGAARTALGSSATATSRTLYAPRGFVATVETHHSLMSSNPTKEIQSPARHEHGQSPYGLRLWTRARIDDFHKWTSPARSIIVIKGHFDGNIVRMMVLMELGEKVWELMMVIKGIVEEGLGLDIFIQAVIGRKILNKKKFTLDSFPDKMEVNVYMFDARVIDRLRYWLMHDTQLQLNFERLNCKVPELATPIVKFTVD
ncbi:Hypothetical predicted protein [Prunus dulcis]|uniref:Uncharacterized protein n=1 Tax=Prunus dulcis TaxID=3755 RepID=A0A5E4G903_PRUDU|nr:Hypothetical predicted protein [Prunus dulcis]